MTPIIALIACSAQKDAHPAPARDLYRGDLFRKAVAFAERSLHGWAVLSAKHGVVLPKTVIEPYDQRVSTGVHKRRQWAVRIRCQLTTHFREGTHFVLLCGSDYRSVFTIELESLASFFTWEAPLAGLGLGYQKQWLAHRIGRPFRPSVLL